ncbi:MAG: hypothetical protein IKP86_05870, partial [Anaerolineaceae bacterium]|nr:hypothetical protein [Anaerolineaceae bacterium]
MKKMICLLLTACIIFTLAAFDKQPETVIPEAALSAETETTEWTRIGYYQDEEENVLSVTWMEDVVEPGWYVGVMIGEVMTGWTIPQEGNTLHGDLNAGIEDSEPYIVTVYEEGEDGLLLVVEGDESYHFHSIDLPDAKIFVNINIEGRGNIAFSEGEEAPEIDPDNSYQSAQINLGEPVIHTFATSPKAGSLFVKWTKNGEDFSTESQITVLLDESADFTAVFEDDPAWQNPVMNFIGEYKSGRAHALVECFDKADAWIIIDWGGSSRETAHWDIVGSLDPDTLTIN